MPSIDNRGMKGRRKNFVLALMMEGLRRQVLIHSADSSFR